MIDKNQKKKNQEMELLNLYVSNTSDKKASNSEKSENDVQPQTKPL